MKNWYGTVSHPMVSSAIGVTIAIAAVVKTLLIMVTAPPNEKSFCAPTKNAAACAAWSVPSMSPVKR